MKKSRNFKPRGSQPPQRPVHDGRPSGRCVVGLHAVSELLKVRPKSVAQIWFRDRYQDHPDLVRLHDKARAAGLKVQLHPPGALDKIATQNQGVLAFSSGRPELDWDALKSAERAIVVALDEVEDPHNLGAVMRTSWLFGVQGILTPELRSADLSPAVSKVAQGAAEHVPVERDQALPQQLERLKQMGFWVLGLSHKGKQGLYSLDIPDKVVWVLGSESSGIRKSVEGVCDDLIAIPQVSPEASYNVSVAAAVALAETYRQAQGKLA